MHTHSSEHTHTVNTHPEQWAANAAAPGEQLGVQCLAQGSHLSRGIEGGESTGFSLLPPTIPARPKTRTRNLTSPTLYPLGHNCCSGSSVTPGHPHTEVHWRLVDTSSIRADGGLALRCHSCSHERAGVKTKCQEKCAFSTTENHLSGCGVGFDRDAGTSVSYSDRVDSHDSRESERRPVTHCQAVSKTAGSDGSCVQRDTFWPAVHETPRGNLLHMIKVTWRCIRALDMWRKPWFLFQGPVLGAPCRRIMLVHHFTPPLRVVEAVGVAPDGAQLIASGLSTEVVETILQSRAPSTRKLYGLKWALFTSWCRDRQLDPVNCPVGTVLEFLQARFSTGLTHSTLKVYVAAIAAYQAPLGGQSAGRHPLVTRFLHGVLRLRPPIRSCVPPWDMAVVIEALCKPPFEPIEEISDRYLTIKTIFLLAFSSLKRVGDLQALSVAPSYLDFALAWPELFSTLERVMFLKYPPLHRGLSYCRPSVLLPSGSPTSKA